MTKAKKFWTHLGIALGYYALFFAIQYQASVMMSTGMGIGLGIQMGLSENMFTFDSVLLADRLLSLTYELIDVTLLLTYVFLAAALLTYLWAEDHKRPLRAARLQRIRLPYMLWTPVLLGIGMFLATSGALCLIPEDFPLMADYIEASQVLEQGLFPVLSIVTTVIGAPLLEEVLFRGMIYKHLKKAMPMWVALLLQAALFGIAHGQILWFAFTFVLGILLGFVSDYFDSIWPCILLHLCFNGCNYLPFIQNLWLEPIGWLILLLASLLFCALTVLMMLLVARRQSPARN